MSEKFEKGDLVVPIERFKGKCIHLDRLLGVEGRSVRVIKERDDIHFVRLAKAFPDYVENPCGVELRVVEDSDYNHENHTKVCIRGTHIEYYVRTGALNLWKPAVDAFKSLEGAL